MHELINQLIILFQKCRYDLGRGLELTNPKEATNEFFKREFPEILGSKHELHNAIFVPDSFLFGDITEKVC
jgi:hypothetical protein